MLTVLLALTAAMFVVWQACALMTDVRMMRAAERARRQLRGER